MKLYDHPLSQNARKVRALVHHLSLPVEIEVLDLSKGAQRTPEFLAINPNGKVPALVDGDLKLWESNAILVYLASKHPESGLLPTDLVARADVERWLFWEASHFVHAVSKVAFNRLVRPMLGLEPDQKVIQLGLSEFARFGKVLDAQLAGRDFVCGPLTIADFALGASAELIAPAEIPLDGLDHIQPWLDRLRTVPGWKESAPATR